MKTGIAMLESVAPYSQSRNHEVPKLDKELWDDFDLRTWREHLHITEDGFVFIPPMSFKQCLDSAAQYLGLKIPGQGNKQWGKKFTSGVLVTEPLILPYKRDDEQNVTRERIYANADGRRGSNKRVWRNYPTIPKWGGRVTFHVLDDTITQEVFLQHLQEAGKFIGLGRFRPQNGGFYGRFKVQRVEWE